MQASVRPVMTASFSASSSFCSSSSTRCSSPRVTATCGAQDHHNGSSRDANLHDLLFAPVITCDFIRVPPDYAASFAYLQDTQLFFFDVLRKLNRKHIRDKRVCFVTDYTINLASCETGTVSRCSKLEDVTELICDVRSRAIGIRMRARPFAVESHNYLHWNCFYEMPVDLLLFAESAGQFADLIRVLRFVYRQCTQKEVPCRVLGQHEEWTATLVLWPDGSRVKKNAMLYHRVPPSGEPPAPTTAAAAAAAATTTALVVATSPGARMVEVPRTRGARSISASKRKAANAEGVDEELLVRSPPPRPPPRRSFSRPLEDARRLVLENEGFNTPTRTCEAEEGRRQLPPAQCAQPPPPPQQQQQQFLCSAVAESSSATKRRQNPLAREWHAEAAEPTSTRDTKGGCRAAAPPSPLPHFFDDAAGLDTEDAIVQLYNPLTSSHRERPQRTRSKVEALEAKVREQQRCIRELRQSGYSKECELDDLKRQLNLATSSHGTQNSRDPSVRRQKVQLPRECASIGGNREQKGRNTEKDGRHDGHAAKNGKRDPPPRDTSSSLSSSSSSNHEKHLSTVKPIQSNGRRGQGRPSARDGNDASAVRGAEQKLKNALGRHRVFEETVWSYYKALPTELQEKLSGYCQDRFDDVWQRQHHRRYHSNQSHLTEELKYLQQLVRQGERARAQSPKQRTTSSADAAEAAMSMVGEQIEALAQELARKQLEIDTLRRQLREKAEAHP